MMLWVKAAHLIFLVTWFAGLFYLPRLLIYHQQAQSDSERQRFVTMERRLFAITTIGGLLTIVFGLALLMLTPAWLSMAWLHAKLLLVGLLIAFQVVCWHLQRRHAKEQWPLSVGALKWFNEIPALLLIGIVLLAVVKPWAG